MLIGIRILNDPSPFQSSIWDIRWVVIFGILFFVVGLLFLMAEDKLLLSLSLIGISSLFLLPLFTIGAWKCFLVLGLLVLIGLGVGEGLLKIILGTSQIRYLDRIVISLLLGFGVLMVLVMIQGFLQGFSPTITWIGLGLLSGIFIIPNLKRWFLQGKIIINSFLQRWSRNNLSGLALGISLLAVIWFPSWLIALSPLMRYDEMTYHVAGPLYFLKKGGIGMYPEGGNTYWLHYVEMLYTLGLQTAGELSPRLLHLLFTFLVTALLFLIGRRLWNSRIGMIAAIIFFTTPLVGYEGATAYIDLFVTAYTTLGGYALISWYLEDNPRWLILAGVSLGFGLGIKLTAGPMIAGLLLTFIGLGLSELRKPLHIKWVIYMVLLIMVLALPWFIQDGLWKGDPIYPFGSMLLQKVYASAPAEGGSAQVSSLNQLVRALKYPYDLVFHGKSYYHEAPGGMASTLPILAAPFFLFSTHFSTKTKKIVLVLVLASLFAIVIMSFMDISRMRYALPIFPWLAVSAAFNLEGLYSWSLDRQIRWARLVLIILGLTYLFSTRFPLIARLYDNLPQRFPLNYVLGIESRDAYLSRNLAVFDAFKFIDEQLGENHRVLSIGNEFRLYSRSRIDGVYDVPEANLILLEGGTAAELAQLLARSGYDYILINQPEVDFRPWKYSIPYPVLKESNFLNKYAELLFVEKGIYVYHFLPEGVNFPFPRNLLKNAGFEILIADNDFSNWEEYGSVEVSKNAYRGKASLLLHAPLSEKGFSSVYQSVSTKEGNIHTLGYWVRADHAAIFLMQLRWLDEKGSIISSEEQWKNISQTWEYYSLFSIAPKGTHFAEVHASLGNTENAYVDEVCLAEGQFCPEN